MGPAIMGASGLRGDVVLGSNPGRGEGILAHKKGQGAPQKALITPTIRMKEVKVHTPSQRVKESRWGNVQKYLLHSVFEPRNVSKPLRRP